MSPAESKKGILGSYRVLDLAENIGFACGAVFAEMGADVIKVEPPGGSVIRRWSHYKNDPSAEKSLFWFAYNLNKKSITLSIKNQDGRDIFKKLIEKADIVIESAPPGLMDGLGLGYETLSRINPGIIVTAITPFGQFGPYRDYRASDLTLQAEGGTLYLTGDEDRPPLQQYPPQAYFLASLSAAEATLAALFYRGLSGQGQFVDASALDSMMMNSIFELAFWQFGQEVARRAGQTRRRGAHYARILWKCKDGNLIFLLTGGGFGPRLRLLVEWMKRENKGQRIPEVKDWSQLDLGKLGPRELKVWEDSLASFFLDHTVREMEDFSQKEGIFAVGAQSPKEIANDPHLVARDFWRNIEHEDLGSVLRYPGPFCRFSEAPAESLRRAPRTGENNEEIYRGELGLNTEQMVLLRGNGTI